MSRSEESIVPSYESTASYTAGEDRHLNLRRFGLGQKVDMEFILGSRHIAHLPYSTDDEIKGSVNLRFDNDTLVKDVSVALEGVATTYVDTAAASPTLGRTTGTRMFLEIPQPLDIKSLFNSGMAMCDQTYRIPFSFTVPGRLLPRTCTHSVENDTVRAAHLELPPSMGNSKRASDSSQEVDDFAPDMAMITYSIRARVAKQGTSGRPVQIGDGSVEVKVLPIYEEKPPMHIEGSHLKYVLRKEKDVKKGFFKFGKTGRLTAEAMQPRSLRLSYQETNSRVPGVTSSSTTVALRFDPQSINDQPPLLDLIVAKLCVSTFFAITPFRGIPVRHTQEDWPSSEHVYHEQVELSKRALSKVNWTRSNSERYSELYNDESMIFYTASILVPITLPTDSCTPKLFLPTFTSCTVSRSYDLKLSISYNSNRTSIFNPCIELRLPIQICNDSPTTSLDNFKNVGSVVCEIGADSIYNGNEDSVNL